MKCVQGVTIEEYGVYTMLPAQQLAPIAPWPPDGNLLDRMDDLAHKGKGNGYCHFSLLFAQSVPVGQLRVCNV
jgi:hypothetical protein